MTRRPELDAAVKRFVEENKPCQYVWIDRFVRAPLFHQYAALCVLFGDKAMDRLLHRKSATRN